MALTLYVRHGAFGPRLAAVRNNEASVAGLCVSVLQHRLAALVPTSALTGLAVSVMAFRFIAISPDGVASVNLGLNAVLMAVVGGAILRFAPQRTWHLVYRAARVPTDRRRAAARGADTAPGPITRTPEHAWWWHRPGRPTPPHSV